MLIDSKFHDYYDGSHGGYIDKTIVYKRETLEIKEDLSKTLDTPQYFNWLTLLNPPKDRDIVSDTASFFFVGFCGKIYVGLCHQIRYMGGCGKDDTERYVYDLPNIVKILQLDNPVNPGDERWRIKAAKRRKQDVIEFYNKYNGKELLSEFYLKHRVPVFYYGDYLDGAYNFHTERYFDRKVVLNPVLKDIEFFKIKIPPDTFREIVTFISNVLTNPEKESPPLPNKLKIISKGFDYKTSFRKPKQDKK